MRISGYSFGKSGGKNTMFQARVSMIVRRISPETSIIDMDGEVNRYSESLLTDAYNQASQGGTRNILLNFTRLDYMNSSGIGLLVTLLVRIQRQGQRLSVYGLNQHYQQIFELTRLNEAINIFSDEVSALQEINQAS
jgi:anti-sigma B factor antagonist